jgi:RNA polymerase sigma-70 factor (ECF subfamily)
MRTGQDDGMDEATLSAVLGRAGAGDRDALSELFRQFQPRVLGLCRYLLGSREDAEDAASEVFVRLQESMKTYDATLPFPKWLMSVASHHCVDRLRRRRVEQRIFDPADEKALEAVAHRPSPLQEALSAEERNAVRAAIEALPERSRLPLVLRYYNELTYDEIAEALNLSRANVATLIFRAKQELRTTLIRRERGGKGKSR